MNDKASEPEYDTRECIAIGIGVLTTHLDGEVPITDAIGECRDEGIAFAAMFVGLVRVAALVLADLAYVTEHSESHLLQDLAARVAASDMPEEG